MRTHRKITALLAGLTTAAAASTVVLITTPVATAAGPADAYSCITSNYVWVVVDDGTGNLKQACATDLTSSMKALESAGFSYDDWEYPEYGAGPNTLDGVAGGDDAWLRYVGTVDTTSGAVTRWDGDGYFEFNDDYSKDALTPGTVEGWALGAPYGYAAEPQLEDDKLNWEVPQDNTPTIEEDLSDVSITATFDARFEARVKASPAPTWTWETSADNGASWQVVDDETQSFLQLKNVSADKNGLLVRATATNSLGEVQTNEAKLTVKPATTVNIPDPAFRACLKDELKVTEDSQLVGERLSTITGFLACNSWTVQRLGDGSTIKDITGVTALQGITDLSIQGNNVTSLSSFDKEMPNLGYLALTDNPVTDLSPLKNLTGLKELLLTNTKVTSESLKDVTALPLTKLALNQSPELTELTLDNSTLAELQAEGKAAAQGNITSIDLTKTPALKTARLSYNQIVDFSSVPDGVTDFKAQNQKVTGTATVGKPFTPIAPKGITGEELALTLPDGVTKNNDGTLTFPEIKDYTLTWANADSTITGTYTVTVKDIARGSVTAKYVDTLGREIADPKIIKEANTEAGTDYDAGSAPDIAGYTFYKLAEGSAPQTGQVVEGDNVVVYRYKANKTTEVVTTTETTAPVATTSTTPTSEVETTVATPTSTANVAETTTVTPTVTVTPTAIPTTTVTKTVTPTVTSTSSVRETPNPVVETTTNTLTSTATATEKMTTTVTTVKKPTTVVSTTEGTPTTVVETGVAEATTKTAAPVTTTVSAVTETKTVMAAPATTTVNRTETTTVEPTTVTPTPTVTDHEAKGSAHSSDRGSSTGSATEQGSASTGLIASLVAVAAAIGGFAAWVFYFGGLMRIIAFLRSHDIDFPRS